MHAFCCYDNIAPNAKCQRVLVLALCLVVSLLQYIGLMITSLLTNINSLLLRYVSVYDFNAQFLFHCWHNVTVFADSVKTELFLCHCGKRASLFGSQRRILNEERIEISAESSRYH